MASLTDRTSTEITAHTRVHGLDALRASALLLGIVLHSLLPFIPGVPWLISDTETSWWAGIPVYVIHLFRMALFMLLAGYFGRMVLHRRGTGAYLRDRLLRIGLPAVVFWPFAVLPLGILVVINAQVHGLAVPEPPASSTPLAAFNPGQLWFLLVLLQCALITVAVRAFALRVLGTRRSGRISQAAGWVLSSPAAVLLAALPYATALLLQGSVLGGIIAPTTILPEAPALAAYLGAFAVGWVLHAHQDSLTRISRWWLPHLPLAVILSLVGLVQSDLASTTPLPAAAAIMALASWCWVYGLLGLCVRFMRADRAWIRYLADASYWMYLMHLPLLIAVEIPLVTLPWPIMVKIALTWLVAGSVLIISYHLLVRSTPIGSWLNGRRYPFRWSLR